MSGFTGRLLDVIRRLRVEIRRHRRFLLIGTAGSLVVVACRLAYAWPLKGVLQTASGVHSNSFVVRMLLLFLVIATLQGVGEYFQRVWFARFALAVSRDVRTRAMQTLARDGARGKKARGEAVSRVVGDTSRFKSGIKGVLIRYTQNGVFFIGVTIALMIIDARLGLVFLVGGTLIVLVAGAGAARVNRIARRLRKKEGRLVADMHAMLASGGSTQSAPSESRTEAKAARAQQQAVLAVHVLLGLTVCAVIALGVHDVRTGVIQSSDLVLVLFFLVQVHNPVLKLGRSTMRLGRALASAERLLSLADRPEQPAAQLQFDLDFTPEPEPEPLVIELPVPRPVPDAVFAHWGESRWDPR